MVVRLFQKVMGNRHVIINCYNGFGLIEGLVRVYYGVTDGEVVLIGL